MVNSQENISKGLVSVKSTFDVKTTADHLERIILDKGMIVFARIDHAKAAQKIEENLRPTELVIFGNPKVGTLLMQVSQDIAIDLPLKVLISEDEVGQVWLSYNDPEYLTQRHNLENCEAVVEGMKKALASLAQSATK